MSTIGPDSASWTVTGVPDWLEVSPLGGQGPGVVTVRPWGGRLLAGEYRGWVTFGAGDLPEVAAVTVTLRVPAVHGADRRASHASGAPRTVRTESAALAADRAARADR